MRKFYFQTGLIIEGARIVRIRFPANADTMATLEDAKGISVTKAFGAGSELVALVNGPEGAPSANPFNDVTSNVDYGEYIEFVFAGACAMSRSKDPKTGKEALVVYSDGDIKLGGTVEAFPFSQSALVEAVSIGFRLEGDPDDPGPHAPKVG
ncbi:hypothetical protein [Vulgatibacter incomptus]|uniref:Uncharacterized protein n=1 Tax=Vulgatibacter incomptus TaxID=1391653 RepID=A0A0K1PFV6_9BACT|nr:hypothetical protein [Vulgatibacter incomptus]AKU92400.1 hypothetical protein AKJ08_2787 [Vulgatibacter incomptus]